MIVSLHVASGAAVGAASGSRGRAVALGLLAHLLGDRMPHQDLPSRRFELRSGVALLLLVAARRGAFDPATIGAAAASSPDLEHVVRLARPGGRKLFPSHRFYGWHRAGGLPTWLQLLAAGALAGLVVAGSPPGAIGAGQGPWVRRRPPPPRCEPIAENRTRG
jgi:hypothetical protein